MTSRSRTVHHHGRGARRLGRHGLAGLALFALACGEASTDGALPSGGATAVGGAATGGAGPGLGGGGATGTGASGTGVTCQTGQLQCGSSCVFPDRDATNCGACGNVCPPGASCVAGACSCQAGLAACGTDCVNLAASAAHCGACDVACAAGTVCSLGACSTSCAAGLTQCGSSCVDLQVDLTNCGACGAVCPGGQTCTAGACACLSGTLCSGACVDTASDPAHCGGCGLACNGSCAGGVCTPTPGAGGTGSGGDTGTGGAPTSGGTGGGNPTSGGTSGSGGSSSCTAVGFINERGRVCPSEATFGIDGNWYAFGDGTTTTESGNPYRDGAYCVTGEAPGDEDYSAHWGAGIGLDLNNPEGGSDTKQPYSWEGVITGFRLRLQGEAPAGARVHFVTDPEAGVSPFITATLGESVIYNVAEAQVPLEWDVANAGQRVDGAPLYAVQIQAPGAEAAGPIDLCITEFEPLYDPGSVVVPDDGPYVNSDGYLRAEDNPFGIQGPVYAIGDGHSTTQSGNPYTDGKYCVAGTFSGAEEDWGAGIAFDLNKAPGGADRLAYAWDGQIGGFRIALSGHSPGPVRVQFIVNEPQDGAQPFLAGLLNTSMVYRIGWAQVPTSWDVANSGAEVGSSLYTVQVYLAGDEPGPFEVCVEDFEPLPPGGLDSDAAPAAAGFTGPRPVDAAILAQEYDAWKANHYRDCGDGSACVPRDGDQNDCISEGIGYGMLLAVAFDDRVAFDKLWQYYKNHRNGSVMDWRTSVCGGVLEAGSATDGELDTAMALIQAGCKWGGSYRSDATTLIGAIRSTEVTTCNGLTVLRAGANFGGCDRTNPSYFSPAYYKVFATLDTAGAATWTALANDSYTLLATLQGKMDGLVPDWTDSSGNLVDGDYGPDASRTPWRIATDYVWNNEAKAVTFLGNVASYVEAHGGVARTLDPNSTYRGPLALSGLPQGATTAKTYADAWLTTAVDDQTYFPGTLRLLYLLLATQQFADGC